MGKKQSTSLSHFGFITRRCDVFQSALAHEGDKRLSILRPYNVTSLVVLANWMDLHIIKHTRPSMMRSVDLETRQGFGPNHEKEKAAEHN